MHKYLLSTLCTLIALLATNAQAGSVLAGINASNGNFLAFDDLGGTRVLDNAQVSTQFGQKLDVSVDNTGGSAYKFDLDIEIAYSVAADGGHADPVVEHTTSRTFTFAGINVGSNENFSTSFLEAVNIDYLDTLFAFDKEFSAPLLTAITSISQYNFIGTPAVGLNVLGSIEDFTQNVTYNFSEASSVPIAPVSWLVLFGSLLLLHRQRTFGKPA